MIMMYLLWIIDDFDHRSVCILLIDSLLKLLECGDLSVHILRFERVIVILSQCLHHLLFNALLISRSIVVAKSETAFVDVRPSLILFFGGGPLLFDSHASKEIVAVEEIVGPNEHPANPEWPDPSIPPGIGFYNEVSVVKHLLVMICLIILIKNDYLNDNSSDPVIN